MLFRSVSQSRYTTCTYYYSSNSGVTFETRQISSTLTFQLISFAASSDFQYVFASGSGTNGGVFVCKTDFGRTFTRVFASTTFQGVGCSPNGRTVVVANNGATPYYSTNYGTSFTTITSETITYAGRRVFVHPDETSFMIRCVSPDAVYCTNVLKPDYTFTDTEYRLATTQPIINSLPGDNESVAHLDRNGKFFFITSNYLSWIPSSFQGANGSQNSITEIGALTDTRFRASMDSKYFLVFSDSKLRLYTAWKESNRATVTSSSIDASSQLTVNWTLQIPNRPVSITWTPKSVLFSQPFIVTDPSATSATIPGFVNIAPSSTVQITVTPLTENGLYNSLMTSPSSSFEEEPFKGSNAYNISDPILPTVQSTCRCIGMSRNGRYVLWGNDNGIFVSSDFGQTMSLKYSSTITPLFTDPNTSLLYSALLSDDGIYIVIYLSSSNSSSCWVIHVYDRGIIVTGKQIGRAHV